MSYKIVGDSCTELPEELRRDEHFCRVALTLQIGEEMIPDDESFDQKSFLKKMKESSEAARSACPSPEAFMEAFEGAEEIYVITLSSVLSGSYNSAELAKALYLEKHPNKKIEVFDSKSAASGQTLIAMKIKECKDAGMEFEEVVACVNKFRDNLKTKFVLESLENFRKNGRLNRKIAALCSVLNIKPVMCGVDGDIERIDQARGMDRAIMKMIKHIEEDVTNAKERICAIVHCNCFARAEFVRKEIQKRVSFRKIMILDATGVSSLYANEGGIVVAY